LLHGVPVWRQGRAVGSTTVIVVAVVMLTAKKATEDALRVAVVHEFYFVFIRRWTTAQQLDQVLLDHRGGGGVGQLRRGGGTHTVDLKIALSLHDSVGSTFGSRRSSSIAGRVDSDDHGCAGYEKFAPNGCGVQHR
jgi:hypothetical protein